MANFRDLPTEIRMLIIQDLDLSDLRLLNSFFFSLWMDSEWKSVDISIWVPDEAIRVLQRMMYVDKEMF